MNSDYIQEDIRLINLYSQSATTYLNGTLKSNVSFNFKNILRDEKDIVYSTIGVTTAQIPVSYYTINENNNILTTNLGNITITKGNYNASSLRTELTTGLTAVGITAMVVTINSLTGILTFTASIAFSFLSSSAYDILGFVNGTTYTSVGNIIITPFPLNLLGIQQLRINSSAFACSNSNSTTMGESNLIGVIQSTAAPFGMILYTNQTSYSVLKNKNISLIDIQILDENGNYVDFNNIDWTLTFQLTTFRRIPLPSNSTDYLQPILATLNTIQSTLQSEANPSNPPDNDLGGQGGTQDPSQDGLGGQGGTQDPSQDGLGGQQAAEDLLTQENQQQQDLFSDDSNSLDIMSYNKQLPS